MSRADHTLKPNGHCRRCGYHKTTTAFCPPGFWMTKEEGDVWSTMTAQERRAYEAKLRGETA